VVLNGVIIVPLFIIPFIDPKGREKRPVEQPGLAAAGVAGVILTFFLSIYSINQLVYTYYRIGPDTLKALTIWVTLVGGAFTYGSLKYVQSRGGYSYELNKCYGCHRCADICPDHKIRDFTTLNLVYNTWQDNCDDYDTCLSCGLCWQVCPLEVDYESFLLKARSDGSRGYPGRPACEGIVHDVTDLESMLPIAEREWPEKATSGQTVGYWPGCLKRIEYFMRINVDYGEIQDAAVKLLQEVGFNPVVLDLKCVGHDQLWQGQVEVFERLKEYNTREILRSGVEKIVATCAECHRTLAKDYPELAERGIVVEHIAQTLAGKDLDLRVETPEGKPLTVTFHDPCRLNRHMGIINEPREVLGKVKGARVVEMKENRELAPCCGISSMVNCNDQTKALRVSRMEQALETKADIMLTACTKCLAHFNCLKPETDRYNFEVMDYAVFLARALPQGKLRAVKKAAVAPAPAAAAPAAAAAPPPAPKA
jgi:Fe-S oxidoreductase